MQQCRVSRHWVDLLRYHAATVKRHFQYGCAAIVNDSERATYRSLSFTIAAQRSRSGNRPLLGKFGTTLSDRSLRVSRWHDGQESDPFGVLAGIKRCCFLACLVIFNLSLSAVTLVFRNGLSNEDDIPLKYRLHGNIFNRRRLQVQIKVSTDTLYELQYADVATLQSHTPSGLQNIFNSLADAWRAGLTLIQKTEILSSGAHPSPVSQPFFTVAYIVRHS